MNAFIIKFLFAIVLGIAWKQLRAKGNEEESPGYKIGGGLALVGALGLMVWAIIGTSLLWVPSGKYATMKKIYFGKPMPSGHVIALNGELGPQAEITRPGFYFMPMVTIINEVEIHDEFEVPAGMCAILSASDGIVSPTSEAFAPAWKPEDRIKMISDATYFLTEGKGIRGQQSTILPPSRYTYNPYLWGKPKLVPATVVNQGHVGVVKAFVRGPAEFGDQFSEPEQTKLSILTSETLAKGGIETLLVPVGKIGVWEKPLPNGLYFINTDCYKVTIVPTTAMVFDYKGGYIRREAILDVDQKGQITQRVIETPMTQPTDAEDTAITVKTEGWEVPIEMRAMSQITPKYAPLVVAALALKEDNVAQTIEDRIMTPLLRSATRSVCGGEMIHFTTQEMVYAADKSVVLDEKTGQPKTKVTYSVRPAKVLDLIENRTPIEQRLEELAREEAIKEGVTVLEIRMSEIAIPAELLGARKREQLAQQLSKSYAQEEQALITKQKTEEARELAEQQTEIVKGQVEAKVAEQQKIAAETRAMGEKLAMIAQAEGQKAKVDVLGKAETIELQKFEMSLKALQEVIEKNPVFIERGLVNMGKLVPNIVITGGTGSDANTQSNLSTATLSVLLDRLTKSEAQSSGQVPARIAGEN